MSADAVVAAMEQAIAALKNTWVPDVQEVKAVDALREAIRHMEDQPADWVGLTDDEIAFIYCDPESDANCHVFARAIESKLKEKNT
jgi:hypothetical protein